MVGVALIVHFPNIYIHFDLILNKVNAVADDKSSGHKRKRESFTDTSDSDSEDSVTDTVVFNSVPAPHSRGL